MAQTEKVNQVIGYIVGKLRSGRMAPGTRLVESVLARETGEGIGPVREALQILNGAGVVQIVENKGARISNFADSELAQALVVLFTLVDPVLSHGGDESWLFFERSLSNAIEHLATINIGQTPYLFAHELVWVFARFYSSQPNKYFEICLSRLVPDLLIARLGALPMSEAMRDNVVNCLRRAQQAAAERHLDQLVASLSACIPSLGLPHTATSWDVAERPAAIDESRSATQRVINYVVNGIRTSTIAPGQRLVEADIMADTGIGRTPVRQALRTLAGDNVVEVLPNRGARVKRLSRTDIRDILVILLHLGKLGISYALDANPLKLVSQCVSEQMAEAETWVERRNPQRFMECLVQYHSEINLLSRNTFLNRCFNALHTEFFVRELSNLIAIEGWSQYLRRYELISKKISAGDDKGANAVFEAHVDDLIALLETKAEKIVF